MKKDLIPTMCIWLDVFLRSLSVRMLITRDWSANGKYVVKIKNWVPWNSKICILLLAKQSFYRPNPLFNTSHRDLLHPLKYDCYILQDFVYTTNTILLKSCCFIWHFYESHCFWLKQKESVSTKIQKIILRLETWILFPFFAGLQSKKCELKEQNLGICCYSRGSK